MRDNKVIVARGLTPLCGWEWIAIHKDDLDGWTPRIEVIRPGARYSIATQNRKALNEAIKVIHGKE